MKDQDFDNLTLQATVLPESFKWPAPDYTHWAKLHGLADECRSRVSRAYEAMDAIDKNDDLTPEGKIKARANLAETAIANFQKSKTLDEARSAVERQMSYWQKKLEAAIKPATTYGEAVAQSQIREHISHLDAKERLGFIDKQIDNEIVISAVFSAPEFLSGLTTVEANVVRNKLAARVLTPEAVEARIATERAWAAAEKGWSRSIELIRQRGGLGKTAKAQAA